MTGGGGTSEAGDNSTLIDPDPVLIAMVAMQAAALVLQFVQVWQGRKANASPSLSGSRTLDTLERQLDLFDRALTALVRYVEREAVGGDSEFLGAPLRVGHTSMRFSKDAMYSYGDDLMRAVTELGSLSLYIHGLIGRHPEFAEALGEQLVEPLDGMAERLNTAMAEGRPIREAVHEARIAVHSLRQAVRRTLDPNLKN